MAPAGFRLTASSALVGALPSYVGRPSSFGLRNAGSGGATQAGGCVLSRCSVQSSVGPVGPAGAAAVDSLLDAASHGPTGR